LKPGSVAFIGDADTVLGFRALGVEAVVPPDPEDAARSFRELVSAGSSVIIVEEDLVEALRGEIDAVSNRPVPAVVILPGVGGSRGRGGDTIRRQILKAVGVDLMAEDA